MEKTNSKIELSDDLKTVLIRNNIQSLDTLLEMHPDEWLKLEGFGWRLVKEVLKLKIR